MVESNLNQQVSNQEAIEKLIDLNLTLLNGELAASNSAPDEPILDHLSRQEALEQLMELTSTLLETETATNAEAVTAADAISGFSHLSEESLKIADELMQKRYNLPEVITDQTIQEFKEMYD